MVPEALIICIIVNLFIFPPRNLLHFLLRITFLDYYLIKLGDIQIFWYISAILLLYLLFPLFYRLIDRLGRLGAAIIIVSSVIITMCAYYFRYDCLSYQLDMLLTRIPVFTTGILIAPLVKKGKKVPTSGVLLICLAGTLYIGLMCVLFNLLPDRFNFARHYLYLPLAVFLVIAFSFIRSHIKADILVRPLEFLGRYSLEMYLIHQTLYYVFMNRISFFADHKLLYAVVCMLASLLLSVILRSFTDRFFDLIHREQGVPRRRKAWSN